MLTLIDTIFLFVEGETDGIQMQKVKLAFGENAELEWDMNEQGVTEFLRSELYDPLTTWLPQGYNITGDSASHSKPSLTLVHCSA